MAPVTAGDMLKFQLTGETTAVELISGVGTGVTKSSISVTVIKIQ